MHPVPFFNMFAYAPQKAWYAPAGKCPFEIHFKRIHSRLSQENNNTVKLLSHQWAILWEVNNIMTLLHWNMRRPIAASDGIGVRLTVVIHHAASILAPLWCDVLEVMGRKEVGARLQPPHSDRKANTNTSQVLRLHIQLTFCWSLEGIPSSKCQLHPLMMLFCFMRLVITLSD